MAEKADPQDTKALLTARRYIERSADRAGLTLILQSIMRRLQELNKDLLAENISFCRDFVQIVYYVLSGQPGRVRGCFDQLNKRGLDFQAQFIKDIEMSPEDLSDVDIKFDDMGSDQEIEIDLGGLIDDIKEIGKEKEDD